jgi:hypothetical protein
MASYTSPNSSAPVTLAANTVTKLFATNDDTRVGWRCAVPESAPAKVYFRTVNKGAAAPTITEITNGFIGIVLPGGTIQEDVRQEADVYAYSTGATTLYPQELN